MTIVMRPTCWHQNFDPNGLSAPAQGLCLNVFSSITADFNISSAIRWAIQDQWSSGSYFYTTGIYAEGYVVFIFPFIRLYVRLFICLLVRTSVLFVELLQSFMCKQLEWSISPQPLIRKHSYLDYRYPGGSAFIPWLLTQGSMPRGGARGQNLGHL